MHAADPARARSRSAAEHHGHRLRGSSEAARSRGLRRAFDSCGSGSTPENLGRVLAKYLSAGDLLIDLAWNIDCCEILAVVPRPRRALPQHVGRGLGSLRSRAVLASHRSGRSTWRHMNVRRMTRGWNEPGPDGRARARRQPGPDLALHQAGPARHRRARARRTTRSTGAAADEMRQSIADRTFNHLAMKLGVKVIHCSERDTQITNRPKQVDEFVNTWSIEGFREEGTTTAEMGWGTHEKELPPLGLRARRRPAQPDLPGPDGHQHLGPLLGARITRSAAWSSATARPSRSPTS